MNPAWRALALFLVMLALFQSLPVAVEAWQMRRWPDEGVSLLRLALLPVALWLYVRYFSLLGCRACKTDHAPH